MNKKFIGIVLAIFAALGAVNVQGQQLSPNPNNGAINIYGDYINSTSFLNSTTGSITLAESQVGTTMIGASLTNQNGAIFYNQGAINNNLYNDGHIYNQIGGTFQNTGNINLGGQIKNYGVWNNSGTISNSNMPWGVKLENLGSFENTGTIEGFDYGGSFINQTGASFYNQSGHLTLGGIFGGSGSNNGYFYNSTGSVLSSSMEFHNTGNLINYGRIDAYSPYGKRGLINDTTGTINNYGQIAQSLEGSGYYGFKISGTVNNYGTLTYTGSAPAVEIDNRGTINNSGTILSGGGWPQSLSGSPYFFKNNGTINNTSGGIINGDGGFWNNGTISFDSINNPTAETTSDLIFSNSGILSFDISKSGQNVEYRRFRVKEAQLYGTLKINLINNVSNPFLPQVGDKFNLIIANDISGAFSFYSFLNGSSDGFRAADNHGEYGSLFWSGSIVDIENGLKAYQIEAMRVTPIPASVWMLLSGLGGLSFLGRKRKKPIIFTRP